MRRGVLRFAGGVVCAVLLTSGDAVAQGAKPSPPGGGMTEGLQVHGHWRVVVRNPDGSVASRHEFNNALVDKLVLLWALGYSSEVLITGPELFIGPLTPAEIDADQAHRICGAAADPRHCRIVKSGTSIPYLGDPPTARSALVGGLEATVSPQGALQVVGVVTAVRDGVISQVGVLMEMNFFAVAMTHRNLTVAENGELPVPPIVITRGQTVEFTVIVSFE